MRGRHKKQSGGHGQFGDVVLTIKPMPRGAGVGFEEKITGGVVPRQYISSVEAGVREYFVAGGPLGFPVVDVAVTLTDGSYHTVDSSDMAFRQAAQIGMREGMPQCEPVLLEPVMNVTVHCPTDATARINADPAPPPRPDRRLGRARKLAGLGRNPRAGAGLGDAGPDHRATLGHGGRRLVRAGVRSPGGSGRTAGRGGGEQVRADGGVTDGAGRAALVRR